MLLMLFICKAFSFGLVGLGLEFTLLPPSNGCQVVICVFLVRVLIESLVKIILPYSGYQLNSHKFCVG